MERTSKGYIPIICYPYRLYSCKLIGCATVPHLSSRSSFLLQFTVISSALAIAQYARCEQSTLLHLPTMRLAFLSSFPLPLPKHGLSTRRKEICCTASQSGGEDAKQLQAILAKKPTRFGLDTTLAPLIGKLEASPDTPDCNTNSSILGVWRNAHTGKSKTSSVIQRTIVASETAAEIQQVIIGQSGRIDMLPPLHVITRVDLRPSLGAILNLRAAVTSVEGNRLNIRFVQGWFAFMQFPVWCGGAKLPQHINIPYPIPFRLLGKKACGWLDSTYLQHDLRVSRGNRGTVFILTRVDERDHLPGLDDIRSMCASESS